MPAISMGSGGRTLTGSTTPIGQPDAQGIPSTPTSTPTTPAPTTIPTSTLPATLTPSVTPTAPASPLLTPSGTSPLSPVSSLFPAQSSIPTSSDALLESTVSSILGYQAQAVTDASQATASTTSASGYDAEGAAYGTAAQIATENEIIAGVGGKVQQLQQQRQTNVTIGEQKAGVAAAGFGASGSSLDLLRSSIQQGYLTQQLTGINTSLTQGGYQEEAAASTAEQAGTTAAASSARAAAAAQSASAATAKAAAANETALLNEFVGSATLTADQQLILGALGPSSGGAPGAGGGGDNSLLTFARSGPANLSLGGTAVPTYQSTGPAPVQQPGGGFGPPIEFSGL